MSERYLKAFVGIGLLGFLLSPISLEAEQVRKVYPAVFAGTIKFCCNPKSFDRVRDAIRQAMQAESAIAAGRYSGEGLRKLHERADSSWAQVFQLFEADLNSRGASLGDFHEVILHEDQFENFLTEVATRIKVSCPTLTGRLDPYGTLQAIGEKILHLDPNSTWFKK